MPGQAEAMYFYVRDGKLAVQLSMFPDDLAAICADRSPSNVVSLSNGYNLAFYVNPANVGEVAGYGTVVCLLVPQEGYNASR